MPSLEDAEAIVVHAGLDNVLRMHKAASLFSVLRVPVVISSGTQQPEIGKLDAKHCLPMLTSLGVPEKMVIVENQAQHTADQGKYCAEIVLEHNWKVVILVASGYHVVRAFSTFVKALYKANMWRNVFVVPISAPHPERWLEEVPDQGLLRVEAGLLEAQRIVDYTDAGDVATIDELQRYLAHHGSREPTSNP